MQSGSGRNKRSASLERFDRWAPSYEEGFTRRYLFQPVHQRLREAVSDWRGLEVIDIGCGTGSLALTLRGRVFLPYGACVGHDTHYFSRGELAELIALSGFSVVGETMIKRFPPVMMVAAEKSADPDFPQ